VSGRARIGSRLLRPWPSALAWLALVFIVSTVPHPKGPEVDLPLGLDKIGHALAYAVLGALAVRAVWRPRDRFLLVAAGLAATVAYGALLEGWQHLIGRDAELGDVIADAVGAAIGGCAVVTAHLYRVRKRSERERSGHGDGGRAQAD
jgi:VanZ family protein